MEFYCCYAELTKRFRALIESNKAKLQSLWLLYDNYGVYIFCVISSVEELLLSGELASWLLGKRSHKPFCLSVMWQVVQPRASFWILVAQ